VKYQQYEKAVYQALVDRSKGKENFEAKAVVMVLGAGRGPLVRASLQAAESAKVSVHIYAVEKNPNAVCTLQNMKVNFGWGDKVTVVNTDMRVWVAPEKADIIVSELLGSFGDNELSPECLDGAQKFLKDDGISIPCEYTSYVSPISSPRVWNEVKSYNDLKHFETAYVVRFFNASHLARPLKCFTFVHPNHDAQIDNSRFATLTFKITSSSMLHGFAGFFDAKLYEDIHISIHPETYSKGMFSWFPLFIPLRVPIHVDENSNVVAHFWRCCSQYKVWYEWCVSSPQISTIHNPNGRSYWIGL